MLSLSNSLCYFSYASIVKEYFSHVVQQVKGAILSLFPVLLFDPLAGWLTGVTDIERLLGFITLFRIVDAVGAIRLLLAAKIDVGVAAAFVGVLTIGRKSVEALREEEKD